MLKLQLLGSPDLLDAGRDISPVLRRPKSLALLAYLAAARPRGFHRRDTLLALFWPDLDQAHARNALRQTVHSLRHELGGHVEIGPYDESALRWLLRLLDHIGRRSDAVREYEEFADRLALDLEVNPSPETRSLMETIRARVEPQLFVSAGVLTAKSPGVEAQR